MLLTLLIVPTFFASASSQHCDSIAACPSNATRITLKGSGEPLNISRHDLNRFHDLVSLSIESYELRLVGDRIFAGLGSLEELRLGSVGLRALRWQALVGISPRAAVDLGGLQLSCVCDNFWLHPEAGLAAEVVFRSGGLSRRVKQWEALQLADPAKVEAPAFVPQGCSLRLCAEDRSSVAFGEPLYRVPPPPAQTLSLSCSIASREPIPATVRLRDFFQHRSSVEAGAGLRFAFSERRSDAFSLRLGAEVGGWGEEGGWALLGWAQCLAWHSVIPALASVPVVAESAPRPAAAVHANARRNGSQFADLRFTFQGFPVDRESVEIVAFRDGIPLTLPIAPLPKGARVAVEEEPRCRHCHLVAFRGRGFYELIVLLRVPVADLNPFVYAAVYRVQVTNAHGSGSAEFPLALDLKDTILHFRQPAAPTTAPKAEGLSSQRWLLIAAILVLLGSLAFCLVGLAVWRRRKRRCEVVELELKPEPHSSVSLSLNEAYEGFGDAFSSSGIRVFPASALRFKRRLGEGAFGTVYLAECAVLLPTTSDRKDSEANATRADASTPVAVKTLNNFCTEHLEKFRKEAEMLSQLDHPNIVRFWGVGSREDGELALVFEFMDLGDLKTFLRQRGPDAHLLQDEDAVEGEARPAKLTLPELLHVAQEACAGLEYLAQRRIVHRDLAARNCLVGEGQGEGRGWGVKVSDFGMSRSVYSGDYYRLRGGQTALPVRWLPPESLSFGTFSAQSDAWSFGVLLWEIFSAGRVPYSHLSNAEVVEGVLEGDVALPIPARCPLPVYELMRSLCCPQPSQRPPIQAVRLKLAQFHQSASTKAAL